MSQGVNGTDPLEGLAAESGESLRVGGEDLAIVPMTMAQIFKILPKGKPVWQALKAKPAQADAPIEDRWLDLVVDQMELVGELCAIALGKQKAFIEGLTPDEFLRALFAVIRVNRVFFMQKILEIPGALGFLNAPGLARDAGSMPLNS